MSQLTTAALRRAARGTVGIYRKIATDAVYAARLTNAIRSSDLTAIRNLFRQATSGFNEFGANGFGFDIGFAVPAPADEIFNASTISGRRTLTVRRLRSLASRILPLYARIASDRQFAANLVLAARAGNQSRLRRLIAPLIRSSSLASVRGDQKSIVMQIRVSGGAVFINQFFVL
ncbi:MAG: hypothetical protein K0S39_2220 [Paenibacillus sp.]|nr:hypothetical protein [Paenibacillus sp.]